MSRKSLRIEMLITLVILFSFGCNLLARIPQPQQMGAIRVVNDHIRGSDWFPGGIGLPDYREYGVCIMAYPPVTGINRPTDDMILVKDAEQSQETTYALPAGTYTLQEFQFDSEINTDPGYSPAMMTQSRPPETIVIGVGETIIFGNRRTLPPPGDFVVGNTIGCGGGSPGQAVFPTETPEVATITPENNTGVWVLKFIQPDVGKNDGQFSSPYFTCTGGAVTFSTETSATITTTGTCQAKNAFTANEVTQHTWSRPPDQLTPGQEVSGTLTASQSGICSWQDNTTEENCRSQVSTSHAAWQGDGWPGGPVEFPYQNLIYGNDYEWKARAADQPTGSFKWMVPDGSYGGKTLLLQFYSSSYYGKVYTNFWYEWQAP